MAKHIDPHAVDKHSPVAVETSLYSQHVFTWNIFVFASDFYVNTDRRKRNTESEHDVSFMVMSRCILSSIMTVFCVNNVLHKLEALCG